MVYANSTGSQLPTDLVTVQSYYLAEELALVRV